MYWKAFTAYFTNSNHYWEIDSLSDVLKIPFFSDARMFIVKSGSPSTGSQAEGML
jgi:hypothetical protein